MVASKVTVGRETPRQFVTAPRLQRCLGFSRVSRHVVILSCSTTRQAVFNSHSHTEKALVPKVVNPLGNRYLSSSSQHSMSLFDVCFFMQLHFE